MELTFEILMDALRNSILITGLVTVMMMMIESLNIESDGLVFRGLKKTRIGQVVIGALLGSVPGCMGGFATVSLYTHGLLSFGALIAMMIASSGDEAFVMLAMIPDKALIIFVVLFVLAIAVGIITDFVHGRIHSRYCHKADHTDCSDLPQCSEGYSIHQDHEGEGHGKKRHFTAKRIVMFVGLAIFIAALASGHLSHEHAGHGHEHEHFEIDLLSEEWMNVLFACLSVIVLIVLLRASDHFIEEHLWNHIVRKHLPTIFAWTFGVLIGIGILLQFIDISTWISCNTALMILLAAAIGFIPESGPHLIFVTLYAAGAVPLPVLLASCISQDGHASIPLLAESKVGFLKAKAINFAIALAAGYLSMIWF